MCLCSEETILLQSALPTAPELQTNNAFPPSVHDYISVQLTSIFIIHPMGKVAFSRTEASEWHRESSLSIQQANIMEVIQESVLIFLLGDWLSNYSSQVM